MNEQLQSIIGGNEADPEIASRGTTHKHTSRRLNKWISSARHALPVSLSLHLAFLLLTYVAPLFQLPSFSTVSLPTRTLLHLWDRWDTGNFTSIATHGYTPVSRTAFFPLYPLLMRCLLPIVHSPLVAGLIVSNVAGFLLLIILHRLVEDDFGQDVAQRTLLLLSIFPTAFFFAAAYNESLFLLLVLLSFYQMRHGQFWLAGTFGLLASLTRSAGLLLLVPFVYEYLRQHDGRLRCLKWDALAILALPIGTLLFALYCETLFHDPLAFVHAQANWSRHLGLPWEGMYAAILVITHRPLLSFDSIHNVIDLVAGLIISLFVLLAGVGPWKFKRYHISYILFGASLLLFPLLVPSDGTLPLQSLSRLVLEVFPAFIVMATISVRHRTFEMFSLLLSVTLLSFLLLQFLTGHWLV